MAAFGLPVGGILLFAFVVKAYLAIFYEDRLKEHDAALSPADDASILERFLLRVSHYNIFIIGFLVLLGIMAYWVVPNFIVYISQLGVETLMRYRWFFIALAVVALGLLIWVIYLRYLLARKSIESRTELEKHRLELEYKHGQAPAALEHQGDPPHLVAWRASDEPADGDETQRLSR